MQKPIRFPGGLISGECRTASLRLDGGAVIDQCVRTGGEEGTFFLEEHLLYAVLGGRASLSCGRRRIVVGKNEMVLLRRAQSVRYFKEASPETGLFESQLYAVTDRLLKDFLTSQEVDAAGKDGEDEEADFRARPMSGRMVAFCRSLEPYFDRPEAVEEGLLRLKMTEMLYNVIDSSKAVFAQMLRLRRPVRADIRRVVEEHYASPVTVSDLAYLSGRSLASFKRDFASIYHASPARWIRERRMRKAHEMLTATTLPVSDICYSLGFENPAHFSRAFKEFYGRPPSAVRT